MSIYHMMQEEEFRGLGPDEEGRRRRRIRSGGYSMGFSKSLFRNRLIDLTQLDII